MNWIGVFGAVILTCLFGAFFRNGGSGFGEIAALACAVILVGISLPSLLDAVECAASLGERAGIGSEEVKTVLRGCGIGILTRFLSRYCSDCGRSALGETAEFCGRIAIAASALPMIVDLAEKIAESV